MDLAENYACKSIDEIQSAYWNQVSVTLHPIVAYFRNAEDTKTLHKSFVVVSDEMSHSANTVNAIIENIMPEIKSLVPNLDFLHYWTDGPTSQYRNKQIFYTVANHKDLYGISARWNYFEVGHGKGPRDGLGGTTKRLADEAVRSGKVSIQDAGDFFKWASQSQMKGVTFLFVSSADCLRMVEHLKTRDIKPVKGTFKLHAVAGDGDSVIYIRDVSCYCVVCIEGGICADWRKECVLKSPLSEKEPEHSAEVIVSTDEAMSEKDQAHSTEVVMSTDGEINITNMTGSFVTAWYDNNWYLGKVVAVDTDENEVEITFMQLKKKYFQWPKREDVIWIAS
jgi:hypothetical protein